MTARAGTLLAASLLTVAAAGPASAAEPRRARWRSRATSSSRSNAIVKGQGDRKQKLTALSDLLRGFLDTDALARLAAGKHLDGRSPAEVQEFLTLFHEFFVRTYVQRLLLFDAPDFTYGAEKVNGDTAHRWRPRSSRRATASPSTTRCTATPTAGARPTSSSRA